MNDIDIKGKEVLVTGATGFLGGRLVETLVLKHQAKVRVLVRHIHKAARIARFPITMVKGHLDNPEDIQRAIKGCEVVFHCAWSYANKGEEAQTRDLNLAATKNILVAAKAADCRRMVLVSTVAVYGNRKDGELAETTTYARGGGSYAQTKREAEDLVFSYLRQGLPTVIIQPTVIYGPWSAIWTVGPLEKLKKKLVAIPKEDGLCNAVYVDDVVQALILAATKEKAVGEKFLISGAEPVSWREFYRSYEEMLGCQAIVVRNAKELWAHWRWQKILDSRFGQLMQPLRNSLTGFPSAVRFYLTCKSKYLKAKPYLPVQETRYKPLVMPNDVYLRLYESKATVKIEKARQLLGYEPFFDLTRGMQVTKLWAQWANLV